MSAGHRLGPPLEGPAPELVASGFHLENADAPLLHAGLNRADLAHVLDLRARGVVPEGPARRLLTLLLEADRTTPEEFPYDPAFGEPYNSRERHFISQIGNDAGWLHAGRPRREAVRIALRLHLRTQVVDLIAAGAALAETLAESAAEHSRTWMPDQTYLQHAQPSTYGHYLLSFAYPVLRDVRRLVDALAWINSSPGGAGCVNGSRLLDDRGPVAQMLGFDSVIEHTRDAMWQTDGLIDVLAVAASLVGTQSKLAEDLEIWASSEFDYVTLSDGYSRSSVLMPQKRNP
ncbi:MAG TPA: lyase family protein, partial [Modestobacter sp.]|nr:lyase family protein [Modestobacter sp.]